MAGVITPGLNGAEGKKWGSSVDTRTRMLMQYNLSAFASVCIYIYIYVHLFVIRLISYLFIHQRTDCRSRIMDIFEKKLSLKVIDKNPYAPRITPFSKFTRKFNRGEVIKLYTI